VNAGPLTPAAVADRMVRLTPDITAGTSVVSLLRFDGGGVLLEERFPADVAGGRAAAARRAVEEACRAVLGARAEPSQAAQAIRVESPASRATPEPRLTGEDIDALTALAAIAGDHLEVLDAVARMARPGQDREIAALEAAHGRVVRALAAAGKLAARLGIGGQ
jgi:hypothetical protein